MSSLCQSRKKLYDAYQASAPAKPEAPAKQQTKTAGEPAKRRPQRDDMTRRVAARIASEMPEGTVASYIPMARAVLSELRDPTNAMLHAAFEGQLDYSDNVEDWQRMIDAALAEPSFDA